MFNEEISNDYAVYSETGSKGSQIKYCKNNFWYKQDSRCDEGIVECLVSEVLKHSSLAQKEYVIYEHGVVNNKHGCRSKDFTENGKYTFVTLEKAYSQLTGRSLTEKVRAMDVIEERRDFVLDFFRRYYEFDLTDYFNKVFTLDLITLNEDRHFNNLGVFLSDDGITNAPIFDNGLSLLNGNQSVNRHLSIDENVKRVITKPFAGSPERQYKLFSQGFSLDYNSLESALGEYPDSFYKSILLHQLERHKPAFSSEPGTMNNF